MADLSWSEFEQVELRVGTIIDAQPFPQARKPASQAIFCSSISGPRLAHFNPVPRLPTSTPRRTCWADR